MNVSLKNDRGAVFLLAVYLSALILLLLGGVSLQRTNTEVRASQVSRDTQQAFWMSEGALDHFFVHNKTDALTAMTTHDVKSLPGATFRIVPVHAKIYNDTNGKSRHKANYVFNPQQEIIYKIEAKSTAASSGPQKVTAYVKEEGPLTGVWANGTIAIGGGKLTETSKAFVSGNVLSSRGSVLSAINPSPGGETIMNTLTHAWQTTHAGDSVLRLDGLIGLSESDPPVTVASPLGDKVTNWGTNASDDLKGIKTGYELMQGVKGTSYGPEAAAPEETGVTFVNPNATAAGTSDYVEGAVSVGLAETASMFNTRSCNHVLTLTQPVVTIDNGFECDDEKGSNTPGVTCDGSIKDRGNGKEASQVIVLCAKAIVPSSDLSSWGGDIINSPPQLVFRKPTTLILTGSTPYSLVGTPFKLPGLPTFPMTQELLSSFGLRSMWNLELSATISAHDDAGTPQTVEILQSALKARPDRQSPHGLIFMRPGDDFQGSIYAPESLVVLRSRSCSESEDGCQNPLAIQYVVGNEVVIELESDHLDIGQEGPLAPDPDEITTSLVTWTGR